MSRPRRAALSVALASLVLAAIGAGALAWIVRHGISARDQPKALEAALARSLRRWAVPAALRETRNPLSSSPAGLSRAREHFADHCASCHGNDGKGKTTLGQALYPKAPDMTSPIAPT